METIIQLDFVLFFCNYLLSFASFVNAWCKRRPSGQARRPLVRIHVHLLPSTAWWWKWRLQRWTRAMKWIGFAQTRRIRLSPIDGLGLCLMCMCLRGKRHFIFSWPWNVNPNTGEYYHSWIHWLTISDKWLLKWVSFEWFQLRLMEDCSSLYVVEWKKNRTFHHSAFSRV